MKIDFASIEFNIINSDLGISKTTKQNDVVTSEGQQLHEKLG